MPYLYYKQKAYGGTSTVNDSEHVIADNGSGSEITSQQLFENILGDLATVEESTTASKAYEVGDYIILNSYFYKVTSAITLGGTIAVGTNVVRTTVGDEFKTFEFPVRELTKAQYNALPTAQQNDGTIYLITDGDGGWEAENASYDNTESGLTATNVQDALDEVVHYTEENYSNLFASNISYGICKLARYGKFGIYRFDFTLNEVVSAITPLISGLPLLKRDEQTSTTIYNVANASASSPIVTNNGTMVMYNQHVGRYIFTIPVFLQ